MYKKTTLDNGLRVITHAMPRMRSVALGIWINVGGRHESEGLKGISHYLEHLLFKGSRQYSCRKIKESIEGVGGSLNGFTSEDTTCYWVRIPGAHIYRALQILSDMVLHPALPGAEVEKERTVILEELKMYKDLPQSYVYELLDELLWPKQPLGASIIGTQDSIRRINREELRRYQKKQYTASNIVVAAAGVLVHDAFCDWVVRIFSGLKKSGINSFLAAQEIQNYPQMNFHAKETEQTHLALGFHGFARDHQLRHALSLLHIILGANMSSRLFNEVREKRGLAYEIGTQLKRFRDTGAFLVHAGIDNRKVLEAVSLILDELIRVKEKPVSTDEFRRAKEFYLGQLELALEDTLDHMLWIGESTITLDKIYALSDIVREVAMVKKEDIRKAARMIFKNQGLNVALIGPDQNQRQSQALYKKLHIS